MRILSATERDEIIKILYTARHWHTLSITNATTTEERLFYLNAQDSVTRLIKVLESTWKIGIEEEHETEEEQEANEHD